MTGLEMVTVMVVTGMELGLGAELVRLIKYISTTGHWIKHRIVNWMLRILMLMLMLMTMLMIMRMLMLMLLLIMMHVIKACHLL